MENYEKKYKEVLEKAKALYKASEPMSGCNVIIETLFPELAESEDEKIKKRITLCLEECVHSDVIRDYEKDECIAWLEKQGEQKHIDKIEPKFKIGDWIINPKTGNVLQIKNVLLCGNKGNYEFDYSSMPIESVDKHYHLWTLEDAKDGDVLACNEEILLFKSYSVQGRISLYCWYNGQTNNFHSKGVDDTLLTTRNKIYLATKEQRDTLLKAMADAGYTFDFEKKELKKIQDEEYNGEDYGIDSLYHAQRILEKTLGKVDGYQTDDGILSHKCAITAVKKLYEQKPAWSEKDVRVIDDIFYSINEESVIEGLNDRGIMYALKDIRGIVKYLRNWLQDLKRRVQPQHKQEWSEEDEEILRTILSDGIRGAELDMLQVNWLKSLKGRVQPQNHWKPSDEQMMALLYHCSNGSVLTSLYNDLNKLKEE